MTTPPSSLPPANWYPDPQTPGQLRYWDGQRWTQHVHPAQQPVQGVGGVSSPQAQAGPGVFLPSGRPGSAQPGQGGVQAQGAFAPTQAGPAQGAFAPTQAGPAQGAFAPTQAGPAQGAFAPTQAGPAQGAFAPTQAGPAQGAFAPTQAGPAQGAFTPAQAGPAQGAFTPTQAGPLAAGPVTGSLRTFQPGGSPAASPFPATMQDAVSLDVDDIPRERGARPGSDRYDDADSTGASTASKFASLLGVLALLATAASVYGRGTGFYVYGTYAAGGLGFLAVLLGFSGVATSLRGEGGRVRSIVAICVGFVAIAFSTYEYLYPGLLYDSLAGYFR